jgi:hypothetical protein
MPYGQMDPSMIPVATRAAPVNFDWQIMPVGW